MAYVDYFLTGHEGFWTDLERRFFLRYKSCHGIYPRPVDGTLRALPAGYHLTTVLDVQQEGIASVSQLEELRPKLHWLEHLPALVKMYSRDSKPWYDP